MRWRRPLVIGMVLLEAGLAVVITALVASGWRRTVYSEHPQEDLHFLIAGMRKERQALTSGICRAHGYYRVTGADSPENNLNGGLTIYAAFDGPDNLRFDRTEPGWVPDTAHTRIDPAHPGQPIIPTKKGIVTYRYCKNGQRAAYWVDHQPSMWIDADIHKPPPNGWGWLDMRALGLYHQLAVQRRSSLVELLAELSGTQLLKSVDKTDPKIWVVELDGSETFYQTGWRLAIDVEHGFTPMEYTCHDSHRLLPFIFQSVLQHSKTTWARVNGAWVPTHYEYTYKTRFTETYSFDLDWENINQPVDSQVFTYRGFRTPPSISIVDMSSTPPVTIWTGARQRR